MKILKTLALCSLFLLAPLLLPNCILHAQIDVAAAARANRARVQSKDTESEWYNPTHVSLHQEDQGEAATSLYEISGNHDLKISIDSTEKGKHETGQMMLISGQRQWLLVKDLTLEKGYEIDALDGAVLNLKLVLELLRAAAPGGPGEIKQKTTVDLHERHRSITLSTASASGGIEPPWALQGSIEPIAAGQESFELTITHSETVHFSGTWQRETAPPAFADDMPLDGWQILSIGPINSKEGNSRIYDYGAQVSKNHPKTLGELRSIASN
jgi:hypothetical protein